MSGFNRDSPLFFHSPCKCTIMFYLFVFVCKINWLVENIMYTNCLFACLFTVQCYVFCTIYVHYIAAIANSLVFQRGSYNNFGKWRPILLSIYLWVQNWIALEAVVETTVLNWHMFAKLIVCLFDQWCIHKNFVSCCLCNLQLSANIVSSYNIRLCL